MMLGINAKEVLTPQGEKIDFVFQVSDGTEKLSGKTTNSKNPQKGGN